MRKYIIKNNEKVIGIIEYDGLIGKFALHKYGMYMNIIKKETFNLYHSSESCHYLISLNYDNDKILCSYALSDKL